MANRAVITTKENFDNDGVGVYLHWGGGKDSVEAFLKYCELKGYISPNSNSYGWASLCGVITNYFGDGSSVCIDNVSKLDCDNCDNGTYIIDDWKIVGRKYFDKVEQNTFDLYARLDKINNRMPEDMQININEGMSFIDDEEKMIDFVRLSKEGFLTSYSYLTSAEYEATYDDVMRKIKND